MKVIARALLIVAALLWAVPVVAQELVVNPTTISFIASADHDSLYTDGTPAVTRYEMRVFTPTGTTPILVQTLGKPTPVSGTIVMVNPAWFLTAMNIQYVAKVAAIGPGGEGLSTASNPFVHAVLQASAPAAPTTVAIKR
jgi:hypothetical protein